MEKHVAWQTFQDVVCKHLGMESGEITEKTNIYRDIGLDSLGIVSLGMRLQVEFNITVPLAEVSIIQTVGDMYKIMLQYC